MSFATKGMTRGVQPKTPAGPASQFGNEFSNAGVIDYRPGITFSGMFEPPTPVIDSKYCVNLDKSGHTVNMHIAQLGAPVAHFAAPVAEPHFASARASEAISDVAARVASELCTSGLHTQAEDSQLAFEMQAHIESLNSQLSTLQGMVGVEPVAHTGATASETKQLQNGLRHHTTVLRKTQGQLHSIQAEMHKIGAQTKAHAEELSRVGSQAESQAADLLRYGGCTETHAQQLSSMDVGLLNHKDELRRVAASVSTVQSMNSEDSASLKKFQSALSNHRDEIRSLKSQPSVREQLGSVQAQIDLLHEGLMNHRAVLASKAEPNRAVTSMHRSDLEGFMRTKQGR